MTRPPGLATCLLLAILLPIVAACGGRNDAGPADAQTSRTDRVVAAPSPPPSPSPSPEPIVVRSPAPGRVELTNRSDQPIELAWTMRIEQSQPDQSWRDVSADTMQLRTECGGAAPPPDGVQPAPDCVTLAPGETRRPMPWTGSIGCTQCDVCSANVQVEPGRYRLVVLTCDHARSLAGDPFTVGPNGLAP